MACRVPSSAAASVLLSIFACVANAATSPPSIGHLATPRVIAQPTSARAATASQSPPAMNGATGVPDGSGGMYTFHSETHGGTWAAPPAPGSGQFTSAFFILRITSTGAVAAGWPAEGIAPTDGARNYDYTPTLVPDASGGVIVLWVDYLNQDAQLKVQRLSDTGTRLWGANGVALTAGSSTRYGLGAIPDGTGGAIACWIDAGLASDPTTQTADLRVLRITSAGSIESGWPADGLLLASDAYRYESARIVTDGSGGAVVCWGRPGRAQRITAGGAIVWSPAAGVALESGSDPSVPVPDGTGGAIFAWKSSNGYGAFQVHAQRLDANGAAQWSSGGVEVGPPHLNTYYGDPVAVEDGLGGAVIGWADRTNSSPYHSLLYALRLTSAGAPAAGWDPGGTLLGDSLGYYALLVPDSAGGAYVAWDRNLDEERIVGTDTIRASRPHLMLQHLGAAGAPVPGWPAAGASAVETGSLSAWGLSGAPTISPAGGLLLAWYGGGASEADHGIYGQRVDDSGARLWGANGVPLYLVPSAEQWAPLVCPGPASGASVAWVQLSGLSARELDNSGVTTGPIHTVHSTLYAPGSPMVADGEGGSFVAWVEKTFNASRVRVQHLDATSAPLWPEGQIANSNGGYDLRFGSMVSDSDGGVIVTWYNDGTLVGQRIGNDGSLRWGAGVSLNLSFNVAPFAQSALIPDGAGGAIVAWENYGSHRVFLQRADSLGNLLWGYDGVQAAVADRDQVGPRLASDGAGGAIVSWADAVQTGSDIRAQRIDGGGQVAAGWPAEGVVICAASGRQALPDIATAADGGAIVAWWDMRGPTPQTYGQRIDGSGVAQWTPDGIELGPGAGAQYLQAIIADGSGGTIAVWMDARGSSWDLYAQRMGADGTRLWGATGLPLCIEGGLQDAVSLASDGTSGAFAAWQDGRVVPGEIFVQKITAAGNLAWAIDGVTETQPGLEIATAEPGVARLVWWVGERMSRATLYRSVPDGEWTAVALLYPDGTGRLLYEDRAVEAGRRYGYRLGLNGAAGELIIGETWLEIPRRAEFALVGLRPNPATQELIVAFSLRDHSPARIELVDVAGRCVVTREVGSLGAGAHVVRLEPGRKVGPGVYWVRLVQGGQQLTRKGTIVR